MRYYVTFSNSDAGVERGNTEGEVRVGPLEGPINFMYDVIQDYGAKVIGIFDTQQGEWARGSHRYTDVTVAAICERTEEV